MTVNLFAALSVARHEIFGAHTALPIIQVWGRFFGEFSGKDKFAR